MRTSTAPDCCTKLLTCHTFLTLTVAELSTLEQVQFFSPTLYVLNKGTTNDNSSWVVWLALLIGQFVQKL